MDTDRGKQSGQLEGTPALTSDARGSDLRRGELLHQGNEAREKVPLTLGAKWQRRKIEYMPLTERKRNCKIGLTEVRRRLSDMQE